MAISVPVRDLSGKEVGSLQVQESVFGVPMNKAVVYQALNRQRANQRAGTHDTLTRAEVSYSTKKPFAQKHTGRARAGMRKSPLWRHGGIIHGPKPRDYHQQMPRKMRRLAIRCLLSDKRQQGTLAVVQDLALADGKTKAMAQALSALGAQGSVLVVTRDSDQKVVRAAKNLPKVMTTPAAQLNALSLLRHQHVVMTVDAVRKAEELWAIDRKRRAPHAKPEPLPGMTPIAAAAPEAAPAAPPKARPAPKPKAAAPPPAPAPEAAPAPEPEAEKPKRPRRTPATTTRSRRAQKEAKE